MQHPPNSLWLEQCWLLSAFQKKSATSANFFNKCLTLTHLLAVGPKNKSLVLGTVMTNIHND